MFSFRVSEYLFVFKVVLINWGVSETFRDRNNPGSSDHREHVHNKKHSGEKQKYRDKEDVIIGIYGTSLTIGSIPGNLL